MKLSIKYNHKCLSKFRRERKFVGMKKILFTVLLLMMMVFTGCGSDSLKVDEEKVFIIGIDDEYAPMGFHDDSGELVGFDIDLAKETAKRMGVTFEFKPIDWDAKEQEITSGNVDIIWSACDIINEYKEYMIFSRPYMNNRQIILARKDDATTIRSESDFAGKIVGTQAGSNSETHINEIPKLKETFAAFKTYRSFKDAFAALNNGEIEFLIVDEIAARYKLKKSGDAFKLIDVTIGPITKFGIGFRKNDTELRDKVQDVLGEMVKDGTAKKISEKWFQANLINFKT